MFPNDRMFERENKEILGQETADFLGGKKKKCRGGIGWKTASVRIIRVESKEVIIEGPR